MMFSVQIVNEKKKNYTTDIIKGNNCNLYHLTSCVTITNEHYISDSSLEWPTRVAFAGCEEMYVMVSRSSLGISEVTEDEESIESNEMLHSNPHGPKIAFRYAYRK